MSTALMASKIETEMLIAKSTSSIIGDRGITIITTISMTREAPTTSERAEASRANLFNVSITLTPLVFIKLLVLLV